MTVWSTAPLAFSTIPSFVSSVVLLPAPSSKSQETSAFCGISAVPVSSLFINPCAEFTELSIGSPSPCASSEDPVSSAIASGSVSIPLCSDVISEIKSSEANTASG